MKKLLYISIILLAGCTSTLHIRDCHKGIAGYSDEYVYFKIKKVSTATRVADRYRDEGVAALAVVDENYSIYIEVPCEGVDKKKHTLLGSRYILPRRLWDDYTMNVNVNTKITR